MKKSEYFTTEIVTSAISLAIQVLVPGTCLSKAEDDEPIFVLRANDPTAAEVIEIWAILNTRDRTYDKIREAQLCAESMRKWKLAQLEARVEALDEMRGES